jgi:hypothetical protein
VSLSLSLGPRHLWTIPPLLHGNLFARYILCMSKKKYSSLTNARLSSDRSEFTLRSRRSVLWAYFILDSTSVGTYSGVVFFTVKSTAIFEETALGTTADVNAEPPA